MQRIGVPFPMENENRHTRWCTHTLLVEKRQFSTDGACFHLGTEFIFGNFLSLMQHYCQDPSKAEVSLHTGSWV